jgi:hypothetical protein
MKDLMSCQLWERAGVPDGHLVIQDIENRPGTEAKFAKTQTQYLHVHAEIQLLFHLAKNKIASGRARHVVPLFRSTEA